MQRRYMAISSLVLSVLLIGGLSARYALSRSDGPRQPLGIENSSNIRVVYQIKDDDWKGEVGAGLHYLNKLVGAYDKMGVPRNEQHIVGVFHGDAGYWLLTDEAYARTGKAAFNPNKQIVQELLDAGVSVELCTQTMKSNGWTDADVLPGVTLVIGAYPRIIDLQRQGYAYIRF